VALFIWKYATPMEIEAMDYETLEYWHAVAKTAMKGRSR